MSDRKAIERVLALCDKTPPDGCIPRGAVLAAIFTDDRPPTQADIERGQQIARELRDELAELDGDTR
jgi:hypothetical protein